MLDYNYAFFYLGNPVKTPIGLVEFKKVKDYEEVSEHLSVLQQTDKMAILKLLAMGKNMDIAKALKNEPLIDILVILKDTLLYTQYTDALTYFFGVNLIDVSKTPLIYTDAELYDYLELIYHMNSTAFPKRRTGNAEIDKYLDYEKQLAKRKHGGNITIESIMSSVAVGMGLSNEELGELTIYQLYVNFYRVGQFKAYDTTMLFRTIDPKIKPVEWNGHVDILGSLNKKEQTLEEFSKRGEATFS